MIKMLIVLCIPLFLMACSEKKTTSEEMISISPPSADVERPQLLDFRINNSASIPMIVNMDGEAQTCSEKSLCEFKVQAGTQVLLTLDLRQNESFLLESWGNDLCSNMGKICSFKITNDLSVKLTGENTDFIAVDQLHFDRENRVHHRIVGRKAMISIPDRIFVENGNSNNKRVIFKFDKGSCIYDGSVDICGVAHCDPTLVFGLKACELNAVSYKTDDIISGYIDIPESVTLTDIELQGKIRKSEDLIISFEVPVRSWDYTDNLKSIENNLN